MTFLARDGGDDSEVELVIEDKERKALLSIPGPSHEYLDKLLDALPSLQNAGL